MEQTRPRRPLFQKYFVILFGAVIVPLIVSGASDAWFGFRDQSALVSNMLGVEARAAAEEIKSFLDGIVDQLGWTVQLPWSEGSEERHKYDLLRLMRQAPAIVDLIQVDGAGIEKMHLSRPMWWTAGSIVRTKIPCSARSGRGSGTARLRSTRDPSHT
jgi:adenylate cyclase